MKNLIINPSISLKEAMKVMSKTGEKCLVVVDENNVLLGTLSDGDIRNKILKGFSMSKSIQDIYNKKPKFLSGDEFEIDKAKEIFIENKYNILPIINNENKIIKIVLWKDIFKDKKKQSSLPKKIPVIIMAGGRGKRMEPFTKVLPKPLIPISDKPVIEHIIENFINYGVNNFFISLNYKSRILRAYFDELQPNYSVSFLEEKSPLGTAGCLKLLNKKINETFILTNCDIILKTDYSAIYEFHKQNNNDITLVASSKEYIIPYGTCKIDKDGNLDEIKEKPQLNFLTNTGFYVINPKIVNYIPKDQNYNITDLIKDVKKDGKKVGVFPIDDSSWVDVGQWADYKKAVESLKF